MSPAQVVRTPIRTSSSYIRIRTEKRQWNSHALAHGGLDPGFETSYLLETPHGVTCHSAKNRFRIPSSPYRNALATPLDLKSSTQSTESSDLSSANPIIRALESLPRHYRLADRRWSRIG